MKVLIVEDDSASRNYLKDTMEAKGHETRTAENGALGLEQYQQFAPNLVISDIQMPTMTGLELLAAIRKDAAQKTIVIITTAYGSEEYAMQALSLGADNYLKKPVRHAELLPLLRKYDELLKDRTFRREMHELFMRREFTMKFDNSIDRLPQIVDLLVQETGDKFGEQERLGIRLGMFELLVNAIEHGNLAITSSEKAAALDSASLPLLYEQRQQDPTLANRKVTVDFILNQSGCEWTISDEGDGFDWQTAQNSVGSMNLLETHGRGIFITRFQFDELEYLGKGNIVRVKKHV